MYLSSMYPLGNNEAKHRLIEEKNHVIQHLALFSWRRGGNLFFLQIEFQSVTINYVRQ